MDVPLSRIINVTLLTTPQGLANFNVNSLAIFTDELPAQAFTDGYKIYYGPDGVATDFGSSSETYEQAVAIFSQSPNILTGDGYLVVIPLETLSADSAGTMLTLTPGDLPSFQAISDGAFKVSVDGTPQELTSLDFTSVSDFDGVATVIDTALTGATCAYDPTANESTGGFLFTSATTGATSAISKLSAPTTPPTDISVESYLNGVGNVRIINGQVTAATEDLVSAVVRTKQLVYYFGILTTTAPSVTDTLNFAGYIQTQDKLFYLGRYLYAEITTLFQVIQESLLTHTRSIYYTLSASEARVMAAAYASRLEGINFEGSNTMSTMNLKTLAGIAIDPDAASDDINNKATNYGFDIYVSVAGDPATLSYGANLYSDEIYGQIWFKLALQVSGYNYLKLTNTKIPQTEPGMDGLKGSYANICLQAITVGFVAAGLTWTSATTFGNPEDLRRNITDAGYYIYSQPISQQNPVDRAARKAPLVQIAIKEAGAIHHSDVIVQVN